MKIIERIFDATTGETTDIEREMTAQEIAEIEVAKDKISERIAQQAEKDAARKAIFQKLGITEEEAGILLS